MVLVLHTDQLNAERREQEAGSYEVWVGSEDFQHDHRRAQDIAVQLMKFLQSTGHDIKGQLKKAGAFLEETIDVCEQEIGRSHERSRNARPFRIRTLPDHI